MGNTAGFTIARSALLIDALSTISASGDEDAMLSKLAAALRWLIGFTRLDFAKTTDDGQRCRVRTLFGAHAGLGEPWEESLSPTSGPAGAFLASGRSWLASDDTRYRRHDRHWRYRSRPTNVSTGRSSSKPLSRPGFTPRRSMPLESSANISASLSRGSAMTLQPAGRGRAAHGP